MASIYLNQFQTKSYPASSNSGVISVFQEAENPFILTFSDVIAWKKDGFFNIDSCYFGHCAICKFAVDPQLQNASFFKMADVHTISCRFEKGIPKKSKGKHIFCINCINANKTRYPVDTIKNPVSFEFVQQEDLKLYLLSYFKFINSVNVFGANIEKVVTEEDEKRFLSFFNDNYGAEEFKAASFKELDTKCKKYLLFKEKEHHVFISSVNKKILKSVVESLAILIKSSNDNQLLLILADNKSLDKMLVNNYKFPVTNFILEVEIKGLLKMQ